MEVCPEPKFKLFVRERFEKFQKCLNTKISWTMAGVVVSIFSVIAYLSYNAYSGEQERQRNSIKQNCQDVQHLKTNSRILEVQFAHIKDELEKLNTTQERKFEIILEKLEKIQNKGGEYK